MLQGSDPGIKTKKSYNYLILCVLPKKMRMGRRQGSASPGWGCNAEFVVLSENLACNSNSLFRIVHFFQLESRAPMPYVQATHPENNVLGDICGMIRYALEIPGRQHEL
jgi:hypothetical protein